MTKIKQVLNLDETANDEQVETAVVSLKDTADQSARKVADLEAEKQTLEAENAALAEQVEALTETAAAAVVDEAVNAGKFDVKDRDALIATAKNGLDAFKATAAAVKPGLPGRVMNRIVADVTNVTDKFNESDGTFDGKKLRELEKSAPKIVADLVKNHSDVYEKMYFAQYGKPLKAAK